MAIRPEFRASKTKPYYIEIPVEFTWNPGFATSQKQKNIYALHGAYLERFPTESVLEISSKSMQEGGTKLSAFHLPLEIENVGTFPMENVYQAGKVFENGGPYLDLLHLSPREAKRDERLQNSGQLIRFELSGRSFPLQPHYLFYHYLYFCGLMQNQELAQIVLQYDAFSDIEFAGRSWNCQARAAAQYVGLYRAGLFNTKDLTELIF